jgi:phage major head subunit gpT-like protein
MNITSDKISAMNTAFDLSFKTAFEYAKTQYQEFCMTVGDADHTVVELPFFEQFSFMRKWVGPRQVKNLSAKKLVMREDAFEDTVGVPVRAIETDNWGVYANSISQMGDNASRLWDRLAAAALCDAGNWIDGKPFFSTDRKYGKSTVGNKTTDALSASTFNAAFEAMCAYCGHDKEPLGILPDTLMVGPKLRTAAFEILNSKLVSDGNGGNVDNPNAGLCKVIVNPRLVGDYDDYWFLMACGGPIKPVAVQKSKEGALVSLNQPTDQNVFMEGQALFGADAYGSAAAAFPHLVYGGIVA